METQSQDSSNGARELSVLFYDFKQGGGGAAARVRSNTAAIQASLNGTLTLKVTHAHMLTNSSGTGLKGRLEQGNSVYGAVIVNGEGPKVDAALISICEHGVEKDNFSPAEIIYMGPNLPEALDFFPAEPTVITTECQDGYLNGHDAESVATALSLYARLE